MLEYNKGDKLKVSQGFMSFDRIKREPIYLDTHEIFIVVYKSVWRDGRAAFYELYNSKNDLTLELWNDEGIEYIDKHFQVIESVNLGGAIM